MLLIVPTSPSPVHIIFYYTLQFYAYDVPIVITIMIPIMIMAKRPFHLQYSFHSVFGYSIIPENAFRNSSESTVYWQCDDIKTLLLFIIKRLEPNIVVDFH